MKKRILTLGVALALVAVLVLPTVVFAADPQTGGTAVTGSLAPTFTLVVPSDFALGGGRLL